MPESVAPPPVLDAARVLAYLIVPDSFAYVGASTLFVDGKALGRVPRLAVCQNLCADNDFLLFHCDSEWNVLGAGGATSATEARAQALRNYPGLEHGWVDLHTSMEDALAFYDQEICDLQCSFCAKRSFQVLGGWARGSNAMICQECVERYHQAFQQRTGADQSG